MLYLNLLFTADIGMTKGTGSGCNGLAYAVLSLSISGVFER